MRRVCGAKVTRLTPGDLSVRLRLATPRGVVIDGQESAEAVVAASHSGEGPNTRSLLDTERSMRDGDAERRAETPERSPRVGGGTAECRETARLSAGNGGGPWWNAGASHMHLAVPNSALHRMGLVSLLEEHRRLASCS
jgi:hypothetical protein